MATQLFVPSYRTEECLEQIRECLDTGWTGVGYKTIEFENEWKKYTGLNNAHFLNSATAGLHLAVKILKEYCGWQDGDEIISTPLTFVSTNHAILYEKLKPVFADVDEHLCLDPQDVERKITFRTRAVMFVGLGGNTGRYPEIVSLCKKYNLKLILDAAHMAGTHLNGAIPGKEADAVVYSFHSVKNLPTADAGVVSFASDELDSICRKYSWLGINKDTYSRTDTGGTYKWKYDVEYLGYKYHGNSIMAAIALVQLKYLDQDNEYRRKIASWYNASLSELDYIKPIPVAPGCESSTHLYIVETDKRDELLELLNNNQIYPGVHYRDNTEYNIYSYARGDCPNAAEKSARILSLPVHLKLTQADIDNISNIITNKFKR
ncbi:MAG: DegT/DnrJ/EryC1/StrS family aminotransferase [Bacillota bacterium]|nr:DegT/DnrJ/EryC1/StrS family aminotransferase [Bacillota bacterium]